MSSATCSIGQLARLRSVGAGERPGRHPRPPVRAPVRATRAKHTVKDADPFSCGTSATASGPTADVEECDVAIIGAGPGGLATALALQARGLDVRVYEQREEFRPAGVAIFIWPHGLNALKSIDPATTERVIAAGAVIDNIAIEQLQPGAVEAEELVKIDVAGWSRRMDLPPQIGITWARLTNALRDGLAPDTVRLGHRLDGMEEGDRERGVVLTFAAPRGGGPPPPPVRVRGCVVGADGRNSRVRELAFGSDADVAAHEQSSTSARFEEASQTPEANVYYALSPNPPPGANGAGSFNELRFSLCNGSGISLLDVGRGNLDLEGTTADAGAVDGGQLMFGTTRFSDGARAFETPEERLRHLKGLFKDTTPLLQAAIASTEPEGVVQTRLYEREAAKTWSKGRVTLLGDAAHCMYPSLGLGISTAFGDAVVLAKCLVGESGEPESRVDFADVPTRLEAYARARIPVTWALQTGSRLMHGILAATAERPAEEERGGMDFTGVFFKAWQGLLWLLGDREGDRSGSTARTKENAVERETASK